MRHPDSHPPIPVTEADFRRALGRFATGVTVVTTPVAGGGPEGVTVNAFASLSLDPPLILVCLAKTTRALAVFEAAGHFAVNVLSESQRHLSVAFSRPGENRFDSVSWAAWTSGCPIFEGCVANLECARIARHDGGDHVILVGRVERLYFDKSRVPLLYVGGEYRSLGKELS